MNYRCYEFCLRQPLQLPADIAYQLLSGELAIEGFESFILPGEGAGLTVPPAYKDSDGLLAFLPESRFSSFPSHGSYILSWPPQPFRYSSEFIESTGLNATWEAESYHPAPLGQTFWVKAPHHIATCPEGRSELLIMPQGAFGSGAHPTTHMMVTLLEQLPLAGATLLDIGCGTGVLAIAALKLGARSARLIDIDPEAIRSAEHNLRLNGFNALCEVAFLEKLPPAPANYSLITANLHRNLIVEHMPRLAEWLAPEGKLLVSGFYATVDRDLVKQAAIQSHLTPCATLEQEGWAALAFSKG